MKCYHRLQLPPNYAWELMDNQIDFQLSKEVNINLIQKLIQLYALGVQYFQSIHSYKYLYFQKKMNSLMIAPQVIESMTKVLQQKKQKNKQIPSQIQKNQQYDKIVAKHKQEQLKKNIMNSSAQVNTTKIKNMIQTTQKQANQYQLKVKNQISQQTSRIMEKIQKRRSSGIKSGFKKSVSMAQLTRHSSSSRSSLENNNQKVQEKLQKLEIDFGNIINQHSDEDQKISIVKKQQIKMEPQLIKKSSNEVRQRNKTMTTVFNSEYKKKQTKKELKKVASEEILQTQEFQEMMMLL